MHRQVQREEPSRVQLGPALVQVGTQPAVLGQADWEDQVGGTREEHTEGRMHTHCGGANHTLLKN